MWRIRRAGPRRLLASAASDLAGADRGRLADLRFGPGGADGVPLPPFTFVEEHFAGSQPCVAVRDARGRLWRVKWGHEAKPESFAVRFAWALRLLRRGHALRAAGRDRGRRQRSSARATASTQDGDVHATRASSSRIRSVRMLFDEHSWAWNDNPFLGTPQLSGLKIVNMLLSNWDTKDRRDVSRGSNTAIFEHRMSRWAREARYLITDWGGAMGKWGSNVVVARSLGRRRVRGADAAASSPA